MSIRNEIKSQIVRAGFTMQEVVDRLHDEYDWSDSVSNLSAKLQRESIRYKEVVELADVLGAEVGASRAAVDAGFADHARQVGQTGVTVRPKLYIACGISGQIQHTAGMDGSAMVISINTDPEAPINKIADYAITGDVNEVIPKMIKYYKQNSK